MAVAGCNISDPNTTYLRFLSFSAENVSSSVQPLAILPFLCHFTLRMRFFLPVSWFLIRIFFSLSAALPLFPYLFLLCASCYFIRCGFFPTFILLVRLVFFFYFGKFLYVSKLTIFVSLWNYTIQY